MQINDGGPAYPCSLRNESAEDVIGLTGETVPARSEKTYSGMRLRDHFAGLAMQGFIASGCMSGERDFDRCAEQIVRDAFLMADAMIRARSQGEQNA